MVYRHATERVDYSDFAVGRVLTGAPGRTAFPVRLADELFQRCLIAWRGRGGTGRATLYDPCCGSGYLLAVLGFRRRDALDAIVGSDVDTDALTLAERNLALLTESGIGDRIARLEAMHRSFGKESHAEALASARRWRDHLTTLPPVGSLPTRLFPADATDAAALAAHLDAGSVDLAIADVPYGQHSAWNSPNLTDATSTDVLAALLGALVPVIAPAAVVAIVSDKAQTARHDAYERIERFQIGKRRVVLLGPRR